MPIDPAIEIKETYNSEISKTKDDAKKRAEYLIRKIDRSEMTNQEAFDALFSYVRENVPSVAVPGLPRLFLENVTVPQVQENYPVYRGEADWTSKSIGDDGGGDDGDDDNDEEHEFGNPKNLKVGSPPLWSFSFQTGSARVKFPYQQLYIRRNNLTPLPFTGIEWNRDGYEGVEVKAPDFKISIKMVVENGVITPAFLSTLGSMVPSVNNANFRGFAAGTLLYNGATIDAQEDEEYGVVWNINHSFDFSVNLTDFDLGPFHIPLKRAHDHAWMAFVDRVVEYESVPELDANGQTIMVNKPKRIMPIAEQLNIAQVYRYTDFSLLGIY